MSLRHLQHLFPIRSVVNTLFKLTLELLFFKKIQNKKNKKIQNLQGIKFEKKKKLRIQFIFLDCFATKQLKITNYFFTYTQRNFREIKKKGYSHTLPIKKKKKNLKPKPK
jgi:fucose permease